jgi:hypothetical protein
MQRRHSFFLSDVIEKSHRGRMKRMARMFGYLAVGTVLAGAAAVAGWVYFVNNVEQPSYKVVTVAGAIEVRDYPALVVAEVTRTGDRRGAVNSAFRPLANYIFAKERAGEAIPMTAPVTQKRDEKIAMTAPVTQSPSGGDGSGPWTVRFIMPSKYRLADLPKPAGGEVTLKDVPAARRAAIRFPGVTTDELVAAKEAELRRWLDAQGLKTLGPATCAYYNDPFTPGPLRRNEVMFDLAPGGST